MEAGGKARGRGKGIVYKIFKSNGSNDEEKGEGEEEEVGLAVYQAIALATGETLEAVCSMPEQERRHLMQVTPTSPPLHLSSSPPPQLRHI